MTLRIGFGALFLAFLLVCSGCGAPTTCDAQNTGLDSQALVTPQIADSVVLSKAGDSTTLGFRARIDNLPELWPSEGPISYGWFDLDVSLAYANAPKGGDGRTEMPRVSVAIASNPNVPVGLGVPSTNAYPGPGLLYFTSELFVSCGSAGEVACCPRGARECEIPVSVVLTRVDGEPFPPVTFTWVAGARAHVNSCPPASAAPSLTLEPEAQ